MRLTSSLVAAALAASLGAASFGAASLLAGCKGADEDDTEPAFVPKTVVFEGKVDEKYAGSWSNADHSSNLDLKKDGSAKIGMTSSSQNGKMTSTLDGQWLVSGSDLLLKYSDSSKQQTTIKYLAALNGDILVLQQAGGKIKTTYTRK